MTLIGKFVGSLLPEEDRMAKFKNVCPREFFQRIDREKLGSPASFDILTRWDGSFPGRIAFGGTGTGKTRACWSVLGRLWVKQGMTFRWYSAKRLVDDYFQRHMDGEPGAFWRGLSGLNIIFLDDADKLELNDRNCSVLFEYADWIAREHQPSLVTTNKPMAWWTERMGDAFARRFFHAAHQAVQF